MLLSGKRIPKNITAALGLLALMALLCSAFFVCLEPHHHHCDEKDCPICMCLQQCRETLRHLTDLLPIVTAVLPALFLSSRILRTFPKVSLSDSPVSRKVRLNN